MNFVPRSPQRKKAGAKQDRSPTVDDLRETNKPPNYSVYPNKRKGASTAVTPTNQTAAARPETSSTIMDMATELIQKYSKNAEEEHDASFASNKSRSKRNQNSFLNAKKNSDAAKTRMPKAVVVDLCEEVEQEEEKKQASTRITRESDPNKPSFGISNYQEKRATYKADRKRKIDGSNSARKSDRNDKIKASKSLPTAT